MKALSRVVSLALALFVSAPAVAGAAALETRAPRAILIDGASGQVLLEKKADTGFAPASISKLMTLYVVFERLASGALSMQDTFPVSEAARQAGGAKMFVEVGDHVTVADLLRGIIVQSANDAAVVIAEGIAGTEAAFAELMNGAALTLGLTGSQFANATGWPDADHVMTVRDAAILSQRIVEDFPELYPMFAEEAFTYRGLRQANRNRLLGTYDGADGLKSGRTRSAGFGLAASAERGGRRLFLVLSGLPDRKALDREAVRLLDEGFGASASTAADHSDRTLSALISSANAGDLEAMHQLGRAYMLGERGAPVDHASALTWYRKAAERGYAKSQNNLGVHHKDGLGVPADRATARRWFRKAADQGLAIGAHNMGVMAEEAGDLDEARRWFAQAAEGGNAPSHAALERVQAALTDRKNEAARRERARAEREKSAAREREPSIDDGPTETLMCGRSFPDRVEVVINKKIKRMRYGNKELAIEKVTADNWVFSEHFSGKDGRPRYVGVSGNRTQLYTGVPGSSFATLKWLDCRCVYSRCSQ